MEFSPTGSSRKERKAALSIHHPPWKEARALSVSRASKQKGRRASTVISTTKVIHQGLAKVKNLRRRGSRMLENPVVQPCISIYGGIKMVVVEEFRPFTTYLL
jgi:hypothetical protein